MTAPDDPTTTLEMWMMWTDNIIEFIDQGLMDDDIQRIAVACFKRRDGLRDKPDETRPKQPRDFPPPFYQHINDRFNAVGADIPVAKVIDPAGPRAKRAKRKTKTPASNRSRQGHPNTRPRAGIPLTFRHTDGRLYNKSDVKGAVIPYEANLGRWIKVVGVGNKSCKVTFCTAAGYPLPPSSVPSKYIDSEGNVKDPIFMSLPVLNDYIIQKKITPIQETADAP